MKRQTPLQLDRLDRLRRSRFLQAIRRRLGKPAPRGKQPPLRILAPSVLSFKNNFEETVQFLTDFRAHTVGDKIRRTVHIDLVPVKEISVPVAIVLAAEFHRWSIVRRIRLRVRDHEKWDSGVRSLFSELGVFDLLGVRGVREELNDKHVTLTKLESGLNFDGRKIAQLQARFRDVLEGFVDRPMVYDGLTEAAENAISHGYPPDFQPELLSAGKRWWGASCLDLEDMRLRFFIFDQGAGIPFTLPSVGWYEQVRELLSNWGIGQNDTLLLRAALQVARTRTGQTNRGLGLGRMIEVIENSETGHLRIISGRGEIVIHAGGRIEERALSTDIGGTLIEWNLPTGTFTEQQ